MGEKNLGRPVKGLKLLYIHQNFPSQYAHSAAHYAANPDNLVLALGDSANLRNNQRIPGLITLGYEPPEAMPGPGYFLAHDFEVSARRGLRAAGALKTLKEEGFEPDLILVHPDWGEAMFIRVFYPRTPVLAYVETYYSAWSPELEFEPGFTPSEAQRCLAEARNATRALALAQADHLSAPYKFQRDQLPEALRARASLLHDGIDTDYFHPDPEAIVTLPPTELAFCATPGRENAPLPDFVPRRAEPAVFTRQDEVFTYVSRTLEPYRGWPSFIRALPAIQRARPEAHCVIAGRTDGGYGPKPEGGGNWRDLLLHELKDSLDFTRIHFTGPLPQETLRRLLAVSRAHVYLTYPFILSYSPLEALSSATPLVCSATAPLLEVVKDDETALTVPFFEPEAIAAAVCRLLAAPEEGERLGRAGRTHVQANYDLKRVCLPRWDKVIRALAQGEKIAPLL